VTSSGVWHICDGFAQGSHDADVVVAWNEFGDENPTHRSLPDLILHNREHHRRALLDFFRRVETSNHGDVDLVDATTLANGQSYWWMTLVFAKRWGELGVLPDAVKVLALADMIATEKPARIIIELSDGRSQRSVAATAVINGITHETRGARPTEHPKFSALRAARMLFTSLRPARRAVAVHDFGTIIADYLFRLEPTSLDGGPFRSQYWGDLPGLLPKGVLWLHRFTPHPSIPSRRHARNLLRKFNGESGSDEHVLLDDLHGIPELRRALRNYRALRKLNRRLPGIAASFRTPVADLWPVFEHDWEESFRGSHAMSMAILMTTLESRIGAVTAPRMGLYIFENQPWEAAMLHAWRQHHAAPLVAVPHSTIRFWDVRYFVSTGTFDDGRFAQPDLITANSSSARSVLTEGGWSTDRIREVEGLMYQYLGEHDPECGSGNDVVVLGEFDSSSTQRYLHFVEAALRVRADKPNVVFKAHPLVDPRSIDTGGLRVAMTTEPVSMLLRRARILVTGASGSTVLEALSRGVPTICVLDPHELDLSSVSHHPILRLVGSGSEFQTAMTELLDRPPRIEGAKPLFHVDASLGRWHALLSAFDPRQ
jgi:surface carbohydrate biosynthesis protein (TIGR04326 family)